MANAPNESADAVGSDWADKADAVDATKDAETAVEANEVEANNADEADEPTNERGQWADQAYDGKVAEDDEADLTKWSCCRQCVIWGQCFQFHLG